MPRSRRGQQSLTAKVLTISAIGMGVGFGTCGLGFFVPNPTSGFANIMMQGGTFLFEISLAALVITALVALGIKIAESFRK